MKQERPQLVCARALRFDQDCCLGCLYGGVSTPHTEVGLHRGGTTGTTSLTDITIAQPPGSEDVTEDPECVIATPPSLLLTCCCCRYHDCSNSWQRRCYRRPRMRYRCPPLSVVDLLLLQCCCCSCAIARAPVDIRLRGERGQRGRLHVRSEACCLSSSARAARAPSRQIRCAPRDAPSSCTGLERCAVV